MANGIQMRNVPIRTSERMVTSATNISSTIAIENGPSSRYIDAMRAALVERRPLNAAARPNVVLAG